VSVDYGLDPSGSGYSFFQLHYRTITGGGTTLSQGGGS
jgi:hypothetical protein